MQKAVLSSALCSDVFNRMTTIFEVVAQCYRAAAKTDIHGSSGTQWAEIRPVILEALATAMTRRHQVNLIKQSRRRQLDFLTTSVRAVQQQLHRST